MHRHRQNDRTLTGKTKIGSKRATFSTNKNTEWRKKAGPFHVNGSRLTERFDAKLSIGMVGTSMREYTHTRKQTTIEMSIKAAAAQHVCFRVHVYARSYVSRCVDVSWARIRVLFGNMNEWMNKRRRDKQQASKSTSKEYREIKTDRGECESEGERLKKWSLQSKSHSHSFPITTPVSCLYFIFHLYAFQCARTVLPQRL